MRRFAPIGPVALWLLFVPPLSAQAPQPTGPTRAVATVVPLAKAKAAANRIDALLADGLKARGETPLPLVDDATFLRRCYLGVVGRIPTLAEAATFLGDTNPDKRALLVDQLLDAPGHVSHEANFWFDLLRVKSRLRQVSGEPFAHWIRASIAGDLPYDEFVRAMLVAEGPAHKEGNGATGFLLRDANMPHDAMANSLRVFLGTRLECAQCHNHPTDRWTQKQFYGMAAFFGGLRYRTDAGAPGLMRTALAAADDRTKQATRRLLQTMGAGLAGDGSGVERLPPDYKYDDAKPRQAVFAATIFGQQVQLQRPQDAPSDRRPRRAAAPAADVDSRAALADWMVAADNPRFSKVIVNRIWQRTFGRGLVEPIDDWKEDTKAVHPQLLAQLERLLVELKFDLRQFQRVLLLTQLFQRQSYGDDPPADQPFAFTGPLLRRLSAEQLWDSLLLLVFADLDSRLRPLDARAREAYDRYREVDGATPEELLAIAQRPNRPGQRPDAPKQMDMRAALAGDAERQQQARKLVQQLNAARRQGDAAEVARLADQLRQMGLPVPGERAARGREGDLQRASDLVQPAPQGHLLRQFGQSDRETVDGKTDAANVPQALTLLNGFLDQRVLSGGSSLRAQLTTAKTPAEKVQAAFLSTLSRQPSTAETERWTAAIGSRGDDAMRDLVWVLCNSNEFRFQR